MTTHSPPHIIQVAVPVPLRKTFDYLAQPGQALDDSWIGCRVRVPFGRREQVGVVLSIHANPQIDESKLKPIIERLDAQALLSDSQRTLGAWMAQFYLHPIGEVYACMLPAALRKGSSGEMPAQQILQRSFDDLGEVERNLKQAKRKLALCVRIAQSPIGLKEAKKEYSSAIVKSVIEKELAKVEVSPYIPNTDWQRSLSIGESLGANIEQSVAISAVNQAKGFQTYLLEGVTGSGKTEVYLQVIAPIVSQGKQVLILVPEIGLTPQTVARFEKRFGPIVGVMHSGLNDAQRLRVWQQAKAGEVGIIIGTRSSIFVPLVKPGMIIVDEEHDESFKQQDGLKYHARDIAVYRAKQLGVPLIMGSATPSLETLQNAFSRKYHHLTLTQRAASASMPSQLLLDMKGQPLQFGIAVGLLEKMRIQLEQGNQVLVFVHRRGFAPALMCHQCGHVETCLDCDNPYTLHKVSQNMQCHRCANHKPIAQKCSQCGNPSLETFGLGTEQIEQGLQSIFPDYSCIRIDSDSTRGKNKLSDLLGEINTGKHQVLIGTQILSKGHHFPNVTMAIILNTDGALYSADFRAPEKLGQLITQLSGRAGRANKAGEVWLQTHQPQHPLLQDLVQNGFADYARSLLLEREHAQLPPYQHQILLRAESPQLDLAESFLRYAQATLSQFSKLKTIGPLPCIIEKKQGRFRVMLIAQSASRQYLHSAMESALVAIEMHPNSAKIRWSIDVAPLDFT